MRFVERMPMATAESAGNGEVLDLEEVRSLREQLEDLQKKMTQAEEKKHTVKPKIFKKVKADYESRAKEIIDQLAERAGPLKEEYDRVRKEENDLRAKRGAVEEELEEVKFRFSLNEFGKEKHDELAGEKGSILEGLEKDIAQVEEKSSLLLDTLKRIDDALKPKEPKAPEPKRMPEPEPEPEPEPQAEPVEVPHGVEAPKPVEHPAAVGEERHGVHVLGERPQYPAEPVAPVAEPSPPEGVHTMSPLDDIVKELEQEMVVPPQPPSEAEEETAGEEAAPEDVTGEADAEAGKEEEKELKCPKCGFVNMADSWYCEKCGAELLGESQGGGG
jgi:ribosomal protein S27AE